MNDLKQISQLADSAIDPQAIPGGILAVEHNALVHSMIQNLGRYVGSPFLSRGTGLAPIGTFLWNGNPMDSTNTFAVTVSKYTQDGNDFGQILAKSASGDILKFKDFAGRSALFTISKYVSAVDGVGNPTYSIDVKRITSSPSVSDSLDYTYGVDEQPCMIEIISSSSGSIIFTINSPIIMKNPSNDDPTTLQSGDWIKTFISSSKIIEGIYNGGSDLSREDSYEILKEITL